MVGVGWGWGGGGASCVAILFCCVALIRSYFIPLPLQGITAKAIYDYEAGLCSDDDDDDDYALYRY